MITNSNQRDRAPIVAVDFDGTLVTNEWPNIGEANLGLIAALAEARALGEIKVILWTCRAGEALEKAVDFCSHNGLEFDAVNENLPEMVELFGGDSRKVFADHYLDDKAVIVNASSDIARLAGRRLKNG